MTRPSPDFARWYAVHVRPCERILKAHARHLLKDNSLAQDAVQDVMLGILKAERWDAIDSPRGYLMRAVHNRALQMIQQRRPVCALPPFEDLRFADLTPDAAQILSGRQELDRLLAFIDRLPPKCRQVVTLRRLDGLTVRQIAARIGVTISTVENHLGLARDKMKTFMAETGP